MLPQLSSESSDVKNPVIPGMRLPEDYDPRIHGKVVHDFSAPRPRRYHSSYETTHLPTDTSANYTGLPLDADTARSNSDRVSPEVKADRGRPILGAGAENRKSGERDHVPVFKEHFGDDVGHWSNDLAALSSERIALTLSNITLPEPNREPPPLPAFARNLPSDVTRTTSYSHEVSENSLLAGVPELAPVVPAQQSFTVPPPVTSPPKATSRKISASDLCFQSAGLPKHLGSTASRFSFDLAGVGSATQEKLLEDRHKKKATTRTLGPQGKVRHVGNHEENADDREDEEEDYMYDDINDDDNLEERIPGINADAEEFLPSNGHDSLRDPQLHANLEAAVGRPIIPDVTASDSSRVVQGLAESSIKSKQIQGVVASQSGLAHEGSMESSKTEAASLMSYCDPSDVDFDNVPTPQETRTSPGPSSTIGLPTPNTDYDDLYYDDGVIAQPQEADTYRFDESVFDDETSMFYEHLNQKITAPLNNGLSNSASGDPSSWSARDADGHNAGLITQLRNHQSTDVAQLSLAGPSFSTLGQQGPQDAQQQRGKPGLSQTVGLTQDNLAAYHDALAYATHQATTSGQYAGMRGPGQILPQNLQVSVSPLNSTSHPGETPERNKIRFDQDDDVFPLDTFGENGDEFDYDDAMEDDPIIAAANAEALENDDEGFYGREFGFYAASSGSSEAQYAHGGYLGARRPDGLTRSHSGRVDFQEPSLTPITERSELSNRNSIISLSLYGPPSSAHPVGPHSAPLPSPGLAQLADLMHLRPDDDDLSLSALLKLRRGAWAGSSASLDSSAGSAHSSASPVTYANALGGTAAGLYGLATAVPPGSSYSPVSSKGNVSFDDDDGDGSTSAPASPTITLQTHAAQPVDSSPVRRGAVAVGGRGKGGHKRNSSGADSVSYIKEKDDEGEGGVRWVVEKRRTAADTGLVEVLGREVVVGGRI